MFLIGFSSNAVKFKTVTGNGKLLPADKQQCARRISFVFIFRMSHCGRFVVCRCRCRCRNCLPDAVASPLSELLPLGGHIPEMWHTGLDWRPDSWIFLPATGCVHVNSSCVQPGLPPPPALCRCTPPPSRLSQGQNPKVLSFVPLPAFPSAPVPIDCLL